MRIAIATENELKVRAFREAIREHDLFPRAKIVQLKGISSGVSRQPIGAKETVRGASNRALRAFNHRDGLGAFEIGVGIESGLTIAAGEQDGMDLFCVCVIHDDSWEPRVGSSKGYKVPDTIVRLVCEGRLSLRQAAIELRYIKEGEEVIRSITGGRVTRLDLMKEAVAKALTRPVRSHVR